MRYEAETIRRALIGGAWQELNVAAGSNDLVSKTEQETLLPSLDQAADAQRAAQGKGARITVTEVIDGYATDLTQKLQAVNGVGPKWLSIAETEALPAPDTQQKIWQLRDTMAAVASEAKAAATITELQRRQVAERFQWDGNPAIKVAFFDADSTVRVSRSGSVSANDEEDCVLLPFVAQKLATLRDEGFLIAIVSNQGGVAHGFVDIETADAALKYTTDLIRSSGGEVHYYDFAEAYDENRKPGIGMADRLTETLKATFGAEAHIDLKASVMVGDSAYKKDELRPDNTPGTSHSNSDRLFAENLGIPFREPQEYFGWEKLGCDTFADGAAVEQFWEDLGATQTA